MLRSKFIKFLLTILNCQVNSSLIPNSPVNFKLKYFELQTKESRQSPNFETFKYSGESLPHVIFLMLFSTREVSLSSNFASLSSVMKDNSTALFLDQTLLTFHGKNQSECKSLRLLSAWIKMHQILFNCETTNQFLFNFFVNLQCNEMHSECNPLYFFSLTFIYFQQKEPIKIQIWWNRKSETWHFDGIFSSK